MTMVVDPPAPAAAAGRISIREYFSAQSDLYTKTDAKRIGPELERLSAEGKTKLKDVVDAARPAASPLHRYFEWDDHRAAEGFRQLQAGRMVRTIRVYTVGGGQERSEPAFQPITIKVTTAEKPSTETTSDGQAAQTSDGTAAQAGASAKHGSPSGAAEASSSGPATSATATDEQADADRDVELIGAALKSLGAWERKYLAERSRPCFEAVFEPVFAAIAEARARDGGAL